MKTKRKLSRIVSVMLALTLMMGSAGMGTMTAYAAEDTSADSTVDMDSTEKPSLLERVVNFFKGEVEEDEAATIAEPGGSASDSGLTKEYLESLISDGTLTITDFKGEEFSADKTIGTILAGSEKWAGVTKVELYTGTGPFAKGVKDIPAYAFYNCDNIKYVDMSMITRTVGDYAFAGCDSLYVIKANSFIEFFGDGAFQLDSDSGKHTYIQYADEDHGAYSDEAWKAFNRTTRWNDSSVSVQYSNEDGDEPKAEDFTITATFDYGAPGAYYPIVTVWDAGDGTVTQEEKTRVLASNEYSISNEETENGWKTTITVTPDVSSYGPNGFGIMGKSGSFVRYESTDGQISNEPFTTNPGGGSEPGGEDPEDPGEEDPGQPPVETDVVVNVVGKFTDGNAKNKANLYVYYGKTNPDTDQQWVKYPAAEADGSYKIEIKDNLPHTLYFINEELAGPGGQITTGLAYAYATVFSDGTSVNVNSSATASGAVLNVDQSTWSKKGDSVTIDLSVPAGEANPDAANFARITGKYVDKNGVGLQNYMVVLDDWADSVKPAADGKYSINVPNDGKTHYVYFTAFESEESGELTTSDWYGRLEVRRYNDSMIGLNMIKKWGCDMVNNSSWAKVGDECEVNVTLTNFDSQDVPGGSEVERLVTVTGKFTDKNNAGVTDMYIVLDNWAKYGLANVDGNFQVDVPNDGRNHQLYFTKFAKNDEVPPVGSNISVDDYFGRVDFLLWDGKLEVTEYTKDGCTVEKVGGWSSAGDYYTVNISLSNYEVGGEIPGGQPGGEDPGDDPEDPVVGEWVTIKGYYTDMNDEGLDNLYVVLDDWNTYATKPKADGSFTIPVDSVETHRIYFTKKDTKGSGAVFSDDSFWTISLQAGYQNKPILTASQSGRDFTYTQDTSKWQENGDVISASCKLLTFSKDGESLPYAVLTGFFVDKNRNGVQDSYIVLDDWASYTVADEDGSYTINIPYDKERHYVYFTNLDKVGKSAIMSDEWYARVRVDHMNSSNPYMASEYKKDVVVETSSTNWNKVGGPITGNVRLSNYEWSGVPVQPEDPGEDPGDEPGGDYEITSEAAVGTGDKTYKTANFTYKDKNHESSELLIVVDDWSTMAVVPDEDGNAKIHFNDAESHKVYFTKVNEKGSGEVAKDDYYGVVSINSNTELSGARWDLNIDEDDTEIRIDLPQGTSYDYSQTEVRINADLKKYIAHEDIEEPSTSNGVVGDGERVYKTLTTAYTDKDGTTSGLYVVVDGWDTLALIPDENGVSTIQFKDAKDHKVYFMKSTKLGTGDIINNQCFGYVEITAKDMGEQYYAEWTLSETVTDEGNAVFRFPLSKVSNSTQSSTKIECSLPNYAYGDPIDPEDPTDITYLEVSGTYVDKNDTDMAAMWIVLDDWANKLHTVNGRYNVVFKDTDEHVLYFTNKKSVDSVSASGPVADEDWYAKVTFKKDELENKWNVSPQTKDANIAANLSTIFPPFGSSMTVNVKLGNIGYIDPGPGEDPGDDPEDPKYDGHITGTIYRAGGKGIAGVRLIVTDSDMNRVGDVYRTDSNGHYDIPVVDMNLVNGATYRLYVMSNNWNENQRAAFMSSDYVLYQKFQYFTANKMINLDSSYNFVSKYTEDDIDVSVTDSTDTHKVYNIVFSNNVQVTDETGEDPGEDPAVGTKVLKSIQVALDGATGTKFRPYIGRTLQKKDFTVTAVYDYTKEGSNGKTETVDYRVVLKEDDWECEGLEEGIKVTSELQSLIFKYTEDTKTVEEIVEITGVEKKFATVSGTLHKVVSANEEENQPMSNYVVYLDTWESGVQIDANGAFKFDDVEDGTYNLYVTKSKKASDETGKIDKAPDSYFSAVVKVEDGVPAVSGQKNGDGISSTSKVTGSTANIKILYNETEKISIDVSGSFTSSTGKGVTDQYVLWNDWENAVLADESGSFKFTGLTEGTHNILFTNKKDKGSGTYSDYTFAKVEITIADSEVQAKATGNDGAKVDASFDKNNNTVKVSVQLSEANESKSSSDTLKENASTVESGNGKVEIKGKVQDKDNKGQSGLGIAMDTFDKSTNTSSEGTFSFTGVGDGEHTLVLYNKAKADLAQSGTLTTEGDTVLASYTIKVADGKIGEYAIKTNNLNQYGFAKESDTVLNITMVVKDSSETTSADKTAADGNTVSGNEASDPTSLLPQTGDDMFENNALLSGLAKLVGKDNPIVRALTPDDTLGSGEGRTIERLSTSMFGDETALSTIIVAIVLILLIAGAGVGAVSIYRSKRNGSDE